MTKMSPFLRDPLGVLLRWVFYPTIVGLILLGIAWTSIGLLFNVWPAIFQPTDWSRPDLMKAVLALSLAGWAVGLAPCGVLFRWTSDRLRGAAPDRTALNRLIPAVGAVLLLGACNAPTGTAPPAQVPSVADAPTAQADGLVQVGPDQTRPATQEEQRLLRDQRLAQERAVGGLTRVVTGEHCVVYTFQLQGRTYMFAEGYKDSGGYYPAMACSVAPAGS